MRRFVSRKATGYVVLLLALVVGAVVVVASAQAAPSTKKYEAYVVAADPNSTSFTLTLVNDSTSQQTLGSANFWAPGLSIAPLALTTFQNADGQNWSVCTGSGGSTCGDGANDIVEFRAASSSDALLPGHSVSFTVSADPTGCTNAVWQTAAKQANDFSGLRNFFRLVGGDLTPLGSFAFAPIETVISGTHVPQIYVNKRKAFSVTAYDTCGNLDGDYPNYRDGYTPTTGLVSGGGLVNATLSATLSWTDGVGTGYVTPRDVEVGDQFSLNDSETGISGTSISTAGRATFDVVETICISGDTCIWNDKGNPITATSTVPNTSGLALGLGYRPFAPDATCTPTGGSPQQPIGDSIYIDPYAYSEPYTIVLTYGKSIVPNGPASDFIVCKSLDNGATWDATAIPPCPKNPVLGDTCADPEAAPHGGLQVTLYLNPGDPHSGGF